MIPQAITLAQTGGSCSPKTSFYVWEIIYVKICIFENFCDISDKQAVDEFKKSKTYKLLTKFLYLRTK